MKTFIQNNKRKLLLILTAVLIVCTFSGFMLTASAFTLATGWTVTYRTDTEAIISTTTEDLDTVTAYSVYGTVYNYGIVVNGQVYGNADVASTLTANKLILGTVGEDFNEGSNYEQYYIYYKLSTDTYFTRADTRTNLTKSSKKVEFALVTITEAGTYTICAVQCSYTVDADDTEYYFTRSAFLTVTVNPDFQIPVPEKTGYTFTGWYTDESCTNLFEEDAFTSDMVLYAGFRPNQYTIVFNGNGHTSGSMSNLVCDYGTSYNLTTNSFVKTGYEFLGWSQTQSATTATYTDEKSIKNLSSIDGATINLYAVWKPSTYTVVFQGPSSSYTMTCSIDQEYTVYDGSTLTKEGHTLTGYSIGENGPLGYALGSTFMNIGQAGETVYLYTCFDVNQIYITFIIPGLNGEKAEVITIEVDWGTPTTDVISQNVDSLLLEVEDGQELPN